MKDKILALMKKELEEEITLIPKTRILELIHKLQKSKLSNEEKREIADNILANYLDESTINEIDGLIGWLLKDAR